MSRFARVILAIAVCAVCTVPAARADEAQDIQRMIRGGQLDLALQRVDTALKEKPQDAQMRFLRGVILTEQGRTADAIDLFVHLTQDYPELPEPYNNLGVLYASEGEYDKARAALEMALRAHPQYPTAEENLGDVYAKLASQAYEKAAAGDATNKAVKTKLGLVNQVVALDASQSAAKAAEKPAAKGVGAVAPGSKPEAGK